MVRYTLVEALAKDIDILTSMKSITMIDDKMDKILSNEEKKKIRKNIATNIKDNYGYYKLIYVDKVIAGAYALTPYEDGLMLDQIYLLKEYRNQGIGTRIINDIVASNKKVYLWVYRNNEEALKLFKKLGFTPLSGDNRILFLKYDSVYIKLNEELSKIRLGYIDRKGSKYASPQRDFRDNYYLQTPNTLMETGIGLCFDQVELERYLVSKMKVDFRTYYMLYQDGTKSLGPAHAFMIYKDSNKYYWYENAWYKYRGLHEYDSLNEALRDIREKFGKTIKDYNDSRLRIYSFDKPRAGINYAKYIGNAINGRTIKV
jgi:N-acetylglutamate synthase-like GNAT family acetyltransferase